MGSYSLSVIGLDVSFRDEADPSRVQNAKDLLEDRYAGLGVAEKGVSKERLLTFVALGLADDLLQSNQKLADLEERVATLVKKIDGYESGFGS